MLSRTCLLTIYSVIVWPHPDYGDKIYEKPEIESFLDWLEKVHYNAALAITGTIIGKSRKCI